MPDSLQLLSFGASGWGDEILSGVGITAGLALATLPLGLVLGFMVALARQSDERLLRLAGGIYTTVFRGLPELLTLFLVYYGAQIGIQELVKLSGSETSIEINSFAAGMVALGMVFSAFASEVFLSAFKAIPRGQFEGAQALGIGPVRTMRLIILPQLIRVALPGLTNLWMILLKETALVSVIGLSDILRQAGIAARVTKDAFLFFGSACLLYLALALISSVAIGEINRRVRRGEAAR